MRPLRIYTDTSVFGGCHDPEFAEHSLRFFSVVAAGRIVVLLSDVVIDELAPAPLKVREVFLGLPAISLERVPLSPEILTLRDAYLTAGVVTEKSLDDATHVAAATVARADAIVSWNFKHIVRLDRMKAYNAVNFTQGYGILTIISPREVLPDENQEE
jgi:predicted nucleic acid-binding protein